MEPKNEQTQNNQATNEQPKKTWVEPELAILGVEGGSVAGANEGSYVGVLHGTSSSPTSSPG